MKIIVNNLKYNNAGVSLLELIVSISIFAVVIIAATQIFKAVVDGQRNAIAAQNIQDNVRYVFEVWSKEIRMARKDEDGACTGTAGRVYGTNVAKDELYFLNYASVCVVYYLADDSGISRLAVERGGTSAWVTPDDINITDLDFEIKDNVAGNIHPLVTVLVDTESVSNILSKFSMKIQTSVSARYYE